MIVGADECGYGSLAGPMVIVAACCREEDQKLLKCRDSKKYNRKLLVMARSVEEDRQHVLAVARIAISADRVVADGYAAARAFAFRAAVSDVRRQMAPRYPPAIVDGSESFLVPFSRPIPKADDLFPCVSFASVVAKLYQCRKMADLDQQYPEYGFASHCGYGTRDHIEAIRVHGAIRHVHRMRIVADMFRRMRIPFKERA